MIYNLYFLRELILAVLLMLSTLSNGQSISIRPVKYHVNDFFNQSNGDVKCTINRRGELDGELKLFLVGYNNSDTLTNFEARISNGILVSDAVWNIYEPGVRIVLSVDTSRCSDAYPLLLEIPYFGGLPLKLFPIRTTYYRGGVLEAVDEFQNGQMIKRKKFHSNGNLFASIEMGPLTKKKQNSEFPSYGSNWIQNGKFEEFNGDSVLSVSGSFSEGNKSHIWHYYTDSGVLNYTEIYGDYYVYKKYFYETGELKEDSKFSKNGNIRDGYQRIYYRNGQIKSETHYNEFGRRDAPIVYFKENGTKDYELSIPNKKGECVYTSWYSNGKVKATGGLNSYSENSGVWNYYSQTGRLDSTVDFSINKIEIEELDFEFAADDFYDDIFFRNKRLQPLGISLPSLHLVVGNFPLETNPHLKFMKKYQEAEASIYIDKEGGFRVEKISGLSENEEQLLKKHFRMTWISVLPLNFGSEKIGCTIDFIIKYIPS